MITSIYIGADKLDLFEDENIIIDSSVAKITDISKLFTDTSNTFNVPASDRNNDILKHWYNNTIDNGFDARTRKSARIELRGQDYKFGKIELLGATLQGGKPKQYNLVFYGNLVSLKDILGDDKLSDLDYSSTPFIYSSTDVYGGIISFTADVRANLITNKRLIYNSDGSVPSDTSLININSSSLTRGLYWYDLFLSIRLKNIITAINDTYDDLNFDLDLFDYDEFYSLYMLLSNKAESFSEVIILDNRDSDPTYSGGVFSSLDETYYFNFKVDIDEVNVPYTLFVKNQDDDIIWSSTGSNDREYKISSYIFENEDSITFNISSSVPVTYECEIRRYAASGTPSSYFFIADYDVIQSNTSTISAMMPDIKVLDFLKSLFKMYKLIGDVDEENNISLSPIATYYRNGSVLDFTDYVDNSEITVEKGTTFKSVEFKFDSPTTILAKEFEEVNDYSYGDKTVSYYDDSNELIDGEEETIELDFTQMVYEKFIDESESIDLPVQYGLMLDESLNKVSNGVHIHYLHRDGVSGFFKLNFNFGGGNETRTLSNMWFPCHTLGVDVPAYSTTFNDDFNEINGNIISSNIYTNYYKEYLDNINSKSKREYTLKVKNLPTHIVTSIELNDVIKIKEDLYRIDTIKSNLLTGEIEFKLIGGIDIDLTQSERVIFDRTDITWDSIQYTWDNI